MNNRMVGLLVPVFALAAMTANAQVCEEGVLYSGTNTPGQMVSSVSTFPEMPEWNANWGDMGGMKSPYIRLSGMKNVKDDWIGAFEFKTLPKSVQGGNLRLKVRATQNAKVGVWLSGLNGKGSVVYNVVPANTTQNLEIPVERLLGSGLQQVEKVWIGLFDVPAYQYTTLFIDDVSLSCVAGAASASVGKPDLEYEPTKTNPLSPVRAPYILSSSVPPASAAYSASERRLLADSTNAKFAVNLLEHLQIQSSLKKDSAAPSESRRQWYTNMYIVERNRLQDSVVANGKAVFEEAAAFAAAGEYSFMPLLVADVDYAYRNCADSSCVASKFTNARLLQAGLPSSFIRGSKLKLVYDPYFTVMQNRNLPSVEVCAANKCEKLAAGGTAEFEFESAGVQKMTVTLGSGGITQKQNLFVEVK